MFFVTEQIHGCNLIFPERSMPGFVLLNCLDALCNTAALEDRQVVEVACGYCGPYLSEHLNAVSHQLRCAAEPGEHVEGDRLVGGVVLGQQDPDTSQAAWDLRDDLPSRGFERVG